jgi:phosphonate transport system substrate-binding protein
MKTLSTRVRLALVAAAAAVLFGVVPCGASGEETLKFGITPRESPRISFQKFTPLARYLSNELGVQVELVVGKDFQAVIDGLGNNQYSIAQMTPSTYPKCQRLYPDAGVRPLVRFQTGGSGTYKACIFVPAGGEAAGLAQLKGKRFAFGDPTSAANCLMPKMMLLEAGVSADKDFAEFKFLGSHTNVANAVAVKTFDGGAAMDSVAERFEKEGKVKIIARSGEMPDAPLCVNKHLDSQLAERIATALLKLKCDNPEGKGVLTSINEKYTGCEAAGEKDYDVIRSMAQKLDGDEWYKKQ